MTTYWLIGEKAMSGNVQGTITVSSVMTTVTSMTTTSNQVSIEEPRGSREDRAASVATCQPVQLKAQEVQSSKQNCQEQNHRGTQKGVQEQQRAQSSQEHRQIVGGQGGSPESQNHNKGGGSKERSGGDGGRGGGKEDGGGGGGGGSRDWNDKEERQGGETFTKGTSRVHTISNGSSAASPSRNRSLVSASSTNVSQGRRPYQASESVANHTESGSSAPLLVPTTPPSRV